MGVDAKTHKKKKSDTQQETAPKGQEESKDTVESKSLSDNKQDKKEEDGDQKVEPWNNSPATNTKKLLQLYVVD